MYSHPLDYLRELKKWIFKIKIMTHTEAQQKSFTVRWKTVTCPQGERCWCRGIKCEEPVMYQEDGSEENDEYIVARYGEMTKEHAEYFVKLHNENIERNKVV